MIKARDAIEAARRLIGTPYNELDCIGLIAKVIRTAPGGVSDYRCQGTNWLWDSVGNSGKYRHLVWRQHGLAGAKAGHVAFKATGSDVHHIGLVTGEGTVIHSSSTQGGRGVVETPLTEAENWSLLGQHRYIEPETDAGQEDVPMSTDKTGYRMQVQLSDANSTLNVRNEPSTKGDRICKLRHGDVVTVLAEFSGWKYAQIPDGRSGYISADYLVPYGEPDNAPDTGGNAYEEDAEPDGDAGYVAGDGAYTSLVSEDGTVITLVGRWRLAED